MSTFAQLVTQSWTDMVSRIRAILYGIVTLSIIQAIIFAVSWTYLRPLVLTLPSSLDINLLTPDRAQIILKVGLTMIGILGLLLALSMIGCIYLLIVAYRTPDTPLPSILSESNRMLFPMIGIYIWVVLRSFSWVPYIGFAFMILLGPRVALAPLIYLKKRNGIFRSVQESFAITKPQWGYAILLMLFLTILFMFGGMIFAALLPLAIILSPWLSVIAFIAGWFVAAYAVVLYEKMSQEFIKKAVTN